MYSLLGWKQLFLIRKEKSDRLATKAQRHEEKINPAKAGSPPQRLADKFASLRAISKYADKKNKKLCILCVSVVNINYQKDY